MAGTKKTDNAYTSDKAALLVDLTRHLDEIRVLDAYGGHGVIWRAVERLAGKPVQRTAVDQRLDLDTAHLHGDNLKVIAGLDLDAFNVIDLDAYGIPVAQIEEVMNSDFEGVVFVTAIQTMQGGLPKKMLTDLGLPRSISKRCPTIASRRGWEFLRAWLALQGVRRIWHRSKARKHYLGFYKGPDLRRGR